MGSRNYSPSFNVILILSIIFSGFYYLPHNAEAQGTPQYNDVSNGLPTQGLWVSKVRFHDIDEDGIDEAFFFGPRKGQGDRSLHVMQWDGNTWSNVSYTFGTEVINHHSYGGFDFGDLDNDGNVDVVAGSHGKYNVSTFYRGSGGNWDESVVEKECESCDSQDAWSIDVGDYNADGRLDVLIGGQMDMVLTPFANSGDGNWIQQDDGIIMGRASTLQGYFVDINRDGFLDLTANLRDGVWVYLGDGNGGWTDSSAGLPVESGTNDSPFSLDWGDFNNDGFVDLALCTVGNDDSRVYAFAGDGTGNWTDSSEGLPTSGTAYRTIRLADMNQDKYDDIVGLTPSGIIETYLATETGGWVKSQNTLQGNAQGYRMEVGDFDHNGHRDIVAGFGTDQAGYPGSVKVWRESTAVSSLGVDMDYPDGLETFRGGSIRFIHWLSEIPSTTGSRSVKVEYTTDGPDGDWTTIAEGLPDTGTFQWEVPFENSADSFLKVTLTDGLGASVDDISDNSFAIISPSNYPPDIELGEPGEAIADGSYSITWVASDPDGDQVAIDLYYDTDTQPNEKQLIAADLENSGEYEWDTSGIAEGDYHLMGVATDSSSQEETDYTSETLRIEHNDLPEITINTPSSQGDIADDSYVIRWQATDPDSDELAIDLLYSMTENLDDAVTIETGLANNGEYEWDTSQIGDGEWFVCGTASDGNLGSEDCSAYTLEINHTQPNNAPEIFIYSPAPFSLIDDGVDVQWSVADADGDLLEIDILFRHSSNTELATISSGLAPSGSLFWDTSALDEGDYYLAISASDGRATTWRNVSVSIVHPEFSVILASIQVIPPDPSEGDNVAFFVIVSSAGGLDGIAELTWSVDGEVVSTALVDLVAGTDGFSQFDWIATSGDHTITVSVGEASQGVMVSVSSAPEVKVEEGLNPWIYSIPVIAAVGGIALLLRRMRGGGGDDEYEFEWD